MTNEELKLYIKQELGEPFHTIHLTDDQIDNKIDKAIKKFQEYHYNGTENDIYLLSVLDGVREYSIPSTVAHVISYYESGSMFIPLHYRMDSIKMTDSLAQVDLISHSMLKMYATTLNIVLTPRHNFTFNALTGNFILEHTPQADEQYGLKVLTTIDSTLIFENEWFLDYIVELCRYQYAWNLSKFDSNLPGVSKVNFEFMMQEAKERLEKLEQELEEKHSAPVPIIIG